MKVAHGPILHKLIILGSEDVTLLVECEVLTAVVTNVAIFWNISSCSLFRYGLHGVISQKMATFSYITSF
jgi:hypothetical protein